MKINPHTRKILLELIRPVVFVTAAAIIISSISNQIHSITRSVSEQRTLFGVLQKRVETIDKIKEDLATIGEENIVKMENAFPPADDISGFISAMDVLATTSGVKEILNFSNPVPFKRYGEGTGALALSSISFSGTLTGTISQLARYFRDMEALPYFISISQINLTSPSTGWDGVSSVSITGTLYAKEIQI